MTWFDVMRDEFIGLVDLLLPPLCLVCRKQPADDRAAMLCRDCRLQLPYFRGACCRQCSLPFAADSGDHLCETCLRRPPAYSRVYCHGIYTGLLREAVRRFKYDNDIVLSRTLGVLFRESLATVQDDFGPQQVFAVPLHVRRLRRRGYNQALLLARELKPLLQCPIPPRVLRRTRPTASQQGLDARARRRNVRGAFAVDGATVSGQKVLLVDDVMTTGATLHECARVLRQAGAADVAAAVIARVDREPEMLFE